MRWQYRVMDLPSWGRGAFAPVPAQSWSAAFNGQNIITGSPGTAPVPAPKYKRALTGDGSSWQTGSNGPEWWLPSIYVAHPNATMLPKTKIRSDHPMPVPAGVVEGFVEQMMHRARIGGRTVTRAIRPFTQWPTYGGN